MQIKNLPLKLIASILIIIIKGLNAIGSPSSDASICVIALSILVVVVIHQELVQEKHERNNFISVFDPNDQAKRMESLLSEEFPLAVLVLTKNLKNIIYTNEFFKTSFKGWI